MVKPGDDNMFVLVVESVETYTSVIVGAETYPRPALLIVNEDNVLTDRFAVMVALIVAEGAEIVKVGAVTYPSPPETIGMEVTVSPVTTGLPNTAEKVPDSKADW